VASTIAVRQPYGELVRADPSNASFAHGRLRREGDAAGGLALIYPSARSAYRAAWSDAASLGLVTVS
jgi:hypothetical protein